MKSLIVEDDYISRLFLWKILKKYGTVHIAVNGNEAIENVNKALDTGALYDLICLDIMIPEMDGQAVLKEIRLMEDNHKITIEKRSKVFMITALADRDNVIRAAQHHCDNFLVKPITQAALLENIRKAGLIP